MTFDAGDNLISSIVFSGGANATIIDNFTSCVLYEELPVSCEGFGPPVGDEPITVNKNRALPLRAELIGVDGLPLTDADIVAPPVLQVLFSAVTSDELPIDVTQDALPVGQSSDGNVFSFQGGLWAYNLSTANYSAPGTYTVKILSGNQEEYLLGGFFGTLPTCEGTFVVGE